MIFNKSQFKAAAQSNVKNQETEESKKIVWSLHSGSVTLHDPTNGEEDKKRRGKDNQPFRNFIQDR